MDKENIPPSPPLSSGVVGGGDDIEAALDTWSYRRQVGTSAVGSALPTRRPLAVLYSRDQQDRDHSVNMRNRSSSNSSGGGDLVEGDLKTCKTVLSMHRAFDGGVLKSHSYVHQTPPTKSRMRLDQQSQQIHLHEQHDRRSVSPPARYEGVVTHNRARFSMR
jgi:hypothetical protein